MVVELIPTFTGSVEFSDFAKKSQICTFVPSTVHLAAFAIYLKNSPCLISFPLNGVLLLTTAQDVPDCESAIVMPVMPGPSSVSQHHPVLLFAQGQVH